MAADPRPRRLAGAVRRRRWLVLGVVGAAVAVSVLVATLSSSTSGYQSAAEVTVARPDLGEGAREIPEEEDERRMATEVYYAESPAVADLVRDQVGADHDRITGVDAEAVEADVVRITVSATSPEVARRGADAYAEVYARQRRQQYAAAFTRQVQDLEGQIEGGIDRLEAIADSLATTDDPGLVQSLTIERDTLSTTVDEQLAQLLDLRDLMERRETSVVVRSTAS